jgi:hypothetical protein
MSHREEPELKVSPAAAEAMRELKELFSDPKIRSTASFRCCTEGPTEFDVVFESITDVVHAQQPTERSMFACGPKRTCYSHLAMSAFRGIADIEACLLYPQMPATLCDVCFRE